MEWSATRRSRTAVERYPRGSDELQQDAGEVGGGQIALASVKRENGDVGTRTSWLPPFFSNACWARMSPAPKRVNAVAHWVTIGLRIREALRAIGQFSTSSPEVRMASLWRPGDVGEIFKTVDTYLNA